MNKKPPRIAQASTPLTVSPFAALSGLATQTDAGGSNTPAAPAVKPLASKTPDATALLAGKLVVAKSRKGRGGRTVVMVTGLRGDVRQREHFVSELKRALGCGAVLEDDVVLVQGDQCERVRDHLLAKGARQVVIGT